MLEYLSREMNMQEYENELLELIKEYDNKSGKHLLIYSVDFTNSELPISLSMDDLYTIKDILRNDESDKLSVYIETPGGSGTAAEEIALFLRKKYEYVDFIVVGECKSAGTILTMCGDKIYLNDTGSLGPIDAQIQIGRSMGSAHDYMKWIHDKMDEAEKNGSLNNFDALMVAQITPNELIGVENSLKYGKELVTNFLKNYKFKNWNETETNHKKVDDDYREKRAKKIADKLSDHSLWKSHGRSLKIDTLCEELELKIDDIGENDEICEIVERIQVLLRLIFSSSPSYKIIADEDTKLVKGAMEVPPTDVPMDLPIIKLNIVCNNCGKQYDFYLNVSNDSDIDIKLQNQGEIPLPEDDVIYCECGYELNLADIRKNLYDEIFN